MKDIEVAYWVTLLTAGVSMSIGGPEAYISADARILCAKILHTYLPDLPYPETYEKLFRGVQHTNSPTTAVSLAAKKLKELKNHEN